MNIINYLVRGHEPKITFGDGFIEFDLQSSDTFSAIENSGNHIEVRRYEEFTGRVRFVLDLDNCYQLNLTKT